MAQGQTYELNFLANLNLGNVKGAINDLQGQLNKLNLPKGLGKSLTGDIQKLTNELNNFQALTSQKNVDKSGMHQIESSYNKIVNLVQKIKQNSAELGNVDLSKLLPTDVASRFEELNKVLKEMQPLLQAKIDLPNQLNALGQKAEESKQKIADLDKEIASLNERKSQISKDQLIKDSTIQELDDKLTKLKQKKEALEAVPRGKEAKSKIVKDIDDQIQKIEMLKAKMQDLQGQRAGAKSDSRIMSLEGQIRQKELEIQSAEKELERLKSEQTKINARKEKVEDTQDYQKISAQVETVEKKLKAARDEAKNLNKELEKIPGQIETKTKAKTKENTNLESINQQIQKLTTVGNIDPTKIDELRQKIADIAKVDISKVPQDIEKMNELINAIQTGELDKVKSILGEVTRANDDLGRSSEETGGKVEKEKGAFQQFDAAASDVSALKSRIQYLLGLNNAINLVKRAIRSAFNTIKELDKAMTETAVVTNFSVGDMWAQLPEYTKRAKELGVTTLEAYQAATLYYQQGLSQREVDALSVETLKMARIAGLDAAEATDRMTNAIRGFNMEINQMNAERVADVYSQLAAVSASNVDEISTAMTKVASLANNANMEFETTAAFLAQIIETTRESAETAGTALKTVVARFSEVKKLVDTNQLRGTDEEGSVIDVNRVSSALRTAGIDLNKYFLGEVGLDDIFMELASKWNSLTNIQQRFIATQAAGSRQQSRFIALMSDYARTQELVGKAYNANGASAKQFAKTQDSLQSKLARLKNSWDEFLMGLTNSNLVKGVVDVLNSLLEGLNKLTTGFNENTSSVLKWLVAIEAFRGLKSIFGMTSVGKGLGSLLKAGGGAATGGGLKTLLGLFTGGAAGGTAGGTLSKLWGASLVGKGVSGLWKGAKGLGAMANGVGVNQLEWLTLSSADLFKTGGALTGKAGLAAGAAGLGTAVAAIGIIAAASYGLFKAWEKWTPAGKAHLAKKEAEKAQKALEAAEQKSKQYNETKDKYDEYSTQLKEAKTVEERKTAQQNITDLLKNAVEENPALAQFVESKIINGELVLTIKDENGFIEEVKTATDAAKQATIDAYKASAESHRTAANVAKPKEITYHYQGEATTERSGDQEQYAEELFQERNQLLGYYSTIFSDVEGISSDLVDALTNIYTDITLETEQLTGQSSIFGKTSLEKTVMPILDSNSYKRIFSALNAQSYDFDITNLDFENEDNLTSFYASLGITGKEIDDLNTQLKFSDGQIKKLLKTRGKEIQTIQQGIINRIKSKTTQQQYEQISNQFGGEASRYASLDEFLTNTEGNFNRASMDRILKSLSESNIDEQEEILTTFSNLDLNNPINALVTLNKLAKNGSMVVSTLAKDFIQLNSNKFSNSNILQSFLVSEAYDEIIEDIEKLREKNGELGAADIEELAKSCGDLDAILKETGLSSIGLARIINNIGDGKISIDSLNDSFVEILNNAYTFDNILYDIQKGIDNFDEGTDYGQGIDFLIEKGKDLQEYVDNFEFGNERTRKLYSGLFGEEAQKNDWKNLTPQQIQKKVTDFNKMLENDAYGFFTNENVASSLGIDILGSGFLDWDITQYKDYNDIINHIKTAAKTAGYEISDLTARELFAAYASHGDQDFLDAQANLAKDSYIKSILETYGLNGKSFLTSEEIDNISKTTGLTTKEIIDVVTTQLGQGNKKIVGKYSGQAGQVMSTQDWVNYFMEAQGLSDDFAGAWEEQLKNVVTVVEENDKKVLKFDQAGLAGLFENLGIDNPNAQQAISGILYEQFSNLLGKTDIFDEIKVDNEIEVYGLGIKITSVTGVTLSEEAAIKAAQDMADAVAKAGGNPIPIDEVSAKVGNLIVSLTENPDMIQWLIDQNIDPSKDPETQKTLLDLVTEAATTMIGEGIPIKTAISTIEYIASSTKLYIFKDGKLDTNLVQAVTDLFNVPEVDIDTALGIVNCNLDENGEPNIYSDGKPITQEQLVNLVGATLTNLINSGMPPEVAVKKFQAMLTGRKITLKPGQTTDELAKAIGDYLSKTVSHKNIPVAISQFEAQLARDENGQLTEDAKEWLKSQFSEMGDLTQDELREALSDVTFTGTDVAEIFRQKLQEAADDANKNSGDDVGKIIFTPHGSVVVDPKDLVFDYETTQNLIDYIYGTLEGKLEYNKDTQVVTVGGKIIAKDIRDFKDFENFINLAKEDEENYINLLVNPQFDPNGADADELRANIQKGINQQEYFVNVKSQIVKTGNKKASEYTEAEKAELLSGWGSYQEYENWVNSEESGISRRQRAGFLALWDFNNTKDTVEDALLNTFLSLDADKINDIRGFGLLEDYLLQILNDQGILTKEQKKQYEALGMNDYGVSDFIQKLFEFNFPTYIEDFEKLGLGVRQDDLGNFQRGYLATIISGLTSWKNNGSEEQIEEAMLSAANEWIRNIFANKGYDDSQINEIINYIIGAAKGAIYQNFVSHGVQQPIAGNNNFLPSNYSTYNDVVTEENLKEYQSLFPNIEIKPGMIIFGPNKPNMTDEDFISLLKENPSEAGVFEDRSAFYRFLTSHRLTGWNTDMNLWDRPYRFNKDGTFSTVDTKTVKVDDKYNVYPTIDRDENGEVITLEFKTDQELADYWTKKGYSNGIGGGFLTEKGANLFAEALHDSQDYLYEFALNSAMAAKETKEGISQDEVAIQVAKDLASMYGVTIEEGDNAADTLQKLASSGDPLLAAIATLAQNASGAADALLAISANSFGASASGGYINSHMNSLTGEEGSEIVWNKEKGYSYITGANGPEFQHLQPGDRVFNASETRRIFRNSRQRKLFGSHANGQGGPGTAGWKQDGGGGGGGGSGKGDKDEKWKNELDWIYNLVQDIAELEREEKALQEEYDDALEDLAATGQDLYNILIKQLGNFYTQLNDQTFALEKREQEMREFMEKNAEYSQYLWYNWEDRTVEIDWNAIEAIQDKELYEKVKEAVDGAEEIEGKMDDAEDAIIDIKNKIQELEQIWRDEFIDFEQRLYDAMVAQQQKVIDEYSELNDNLNNTNQNILTALQQQISLQRQIRDNTKTEEELGNQEAKLAFLRRDTTGGNDLAALQLEKDLNDQRQSYEDTLIDQAIDRLSEDNDQAAEQRDKQIEIMQAQLDYQAENGEFNEAVRSLLEGSIEPDTALANIENMKDILKATDNYDAMTDAEKAAWEAEFHKQYSQAAAYIIEQKNLVTGDHLKFIQTAIEGTTKMLGDYSQALEKGAGAGSGGGGGGGGGEYSGGSTPTKATKTTEKDRVLRTGDGKYGIIFKGEMLAGKYTSPTEAQRTLEMFKRNKGTGFATGGLNTQTGLAWLDGTPSEPEYVLNARQTDAFLRLADVLPAAMSGDSFSSASFGNTTITIPITVESIGSDYDVDRLADRVKSIIYDAGTYRNVNTLNFLR